MSVEVVTNDASTGRVVKQGEDPREPVECINANAHPEHRGHEFTMADPGYPNNERVVKYSIAPGERFMAPRGYTVPKVAAGDGSVAVPSILEMLAPGCVPVTHPKALAYLRAAGTQPAQEKRK